MKKSNIVTEKNSTTSHTKDAELSSATGIPDNMNEINLMGSYIKEQKGDILDLQERMKEVEGELKKQATRSIEIIGIFSAIIALIIIDVNIISSVDNFLNAILLVVGLTTAMIIFACMIHFLFNSSEKRRGIANWGLIISTVILAALVIIGSLISSDIIELKSDNLTGYYYPDKNNLDIYISQSDLKNINECRNWIGDISEKNENFDYNCGVNCEYDDYLKHSVCEKNLK